MSKSSCLHPDPARAVLVVVDLQERFARVMPKNTFRSVIQNTNILIAAARELQFPILVTEQYPKGLGPTIKELKEALAGIQPIEKVTFSCCGEENFMQALRASGGQDIILCGIETHVCLLQTAFDLVEANYNVFAAADAMCSRKDLNWSLALDGMRQAGVAVASTETLLFQLLRVAGTPAFKKLSALVK